MTFIQVGGDNSVQTQGDKNMWLVTYSDGSIDEFSDELTIELVIEYADNRKSIVKVELVH